MLLYLTSRLDKFRPVFHTVKHVAVFRNQEEAERDGMVRPDQKRCRFLGGRRSREARKSGGISTESARSNRLGQEPGLRGSARASRERTLGLRRWTQIWREAQWHWRRCCNRDFRRRERAIFSSISEILRWASFFQRGPTGTLSRKSSRNSAPVLLAPR